MRWLSGIVIVVVLVSTTFEAQSARRTVRAAATTSDDFPRSAAVAAGDYVYVSGQMGREADGSFGDVRAQTKRALDNIAAILEQAGTSLEQAVSSYVYLRHKGDFAAMNEVYRAHPKWPKTTHPTANGDDLDLAVRTTMTADLIGPAEAFVQITIIALRQGAERTIVQPAEWRKSNLPYPWAIKSGDTLWISGLVPSDKRGNPFKRGDMKADVRQTLTDVGECLTTAGMSFADVVFSRVYIQDHTLTRDMDEAYRSFYPADPPVRATLRAGIMGNATHDEITTIAVKAPKRVISIPNAERDPSASTALVVGNRFFSSGIQGVTAATKGDVKAETREALSRLGAALKAGGFGWEHVVDTWILLSDTRDYAAMTEAYREVFKDNFPASTVVGEQPLGRGRVQIQIMAVK